MGPEASTGGQRADLKRVDQLEPYSFGPIVLARLKSFIQNAPDHELYQLNPYYVAERLRLDEHTALKLIVAAVAERLFELNWHVVCSQCGMQNDASTLAQVNQLHECIDCGHELDAYLDEEITVTISIREAARRLSPNQRYNHRFSTRADERFGPMSALTLIGVPLFRDLITDQLLPEGQSLGVRRLVIFFSDLRSSTALYHKFGDARAYRWVCDHFNIVFDAVAHQRGSAVKTIGDGVMGVFTETPAALRAIANAMAGLADLNQRAGLTDDDRLALKVGLHQGPCIVVTLNRRLDYFGETVNVAARLGGLAEGNELILSQAILDDAAAAGVIGELGAVRTFDAKLRGLPGLHQLYRLQFTPAGAES